MAKEIINIGTSPNDGTGDPLRTAMEKSNSNFTELYDGTERDQIDFNPALATPPAYQEGRVFYDKDKNALSYFNSDPDMTVNIGQELIMEVWNGTGNTITNGQCVRMGVGDTNGFPNVVLSIADTVINSGVVGVVTGTIQNGSSGFICLWGSVGGIDTSVWGSGNLFLSSTVAGALTTIEQPILKPVGVVSFVDATNGRIIVGQRAVVNPTCIGQASNHTVASFDQDITTTPQPLSLYDNVKFEKNVSVIETAVAGSGYRASMVPNSAGAQGYYQLAFSISITSSANRLISFEVYINGVATGVVSVVDLSNNNIDAGSTSFSVISEQILTTTDQLEMYVYGDGNAPLTVQQLTMNITRIGTV